MESSGGERTLFQTTQWTVVLGSARRGEEEGHRCLESLCETYWRPLYRFARRLGNSPSDAEDLVQSFFEVLLGREGFAGASPEGGKFRAYLLAAFKKHAAEDHRRAQRLKRGGGVLTLSLDWESEESGLKIEADDPRSPDVLYDQDWARVLLDGVLEKVAARFREEERGHEFEAMRGYLTVRSEQVKYRELAEELGMTEGAARVAVHRLRKLYRHALRDEIAGTLSKEESVEEEMRALFLALTERD